MAEIVKRLANSLAVFTKHHEPWMDRWPDDAQSSTSSRHTFGQLREALRLIEEADRFSVGLADGWRTMETAPKDGTAIIGRTVAEDVFACNWFDDEDGGSWLQYGTDEVRPREWVPMPTHSTPYVMVSREAASLGASALRDRMESEAYHTDIAAEIELRKAAEASTEATGGEHDVE